MATTGDVFATGGCKVIGGISTVTGCGAFGGGPLAFMWTSDRSLSSRDCGDVVLVRSFFLGAPLNGHGNFGKATLGNRTLGVCFGACFVAFGGMIAVGWCPTLVGCFIGYDLFGTA